MYKNTEEFFSAAQESVELFNTWAEIFSPDASADHICYKCNSGEEFETLRKMFENNSGFIYQSIISARRIAIIKFSKPITSPLGDIWYLELSDQRTDGSQMSGFDHIEIYPRKESMDDLARKLQEQGMTLEKTIRPHHTTYDSFLSEVFKVRLEPDALIGKIKREEMR
ncbi:MAG: VOC family protein [Patescibacteria group bacterium]